MARIAAVLGRGDDAARYAELADQRPGRVAGGVHRRRRPAHARTPRPITSARWPSTWCPTELRPAVADRLVELIRDADTHLGTGFLATPYLLPVLADTGHLDVAYELLLQDTEPSWLVMVDRGATTVWERWNGVSADGVPHESLNHYSKGAVISFLHRYIAGIELLDDGPAYRRFRIRPRPGGGLTSAEAAHESPYGRIESAWRLDGDTLRAPRRRPGRHAGGGRAARRAHHDRRPRRAHLLHQQRCATEKPTLTMTAAETSEWAGPTRFLPPTEPTRRDDGALHFSGITYAVAFGYRPLQLDLVGAGRRRAARRWWCGSTAAASCSATAATCRRRCGPNQVFDALLDAGLAVATIDYRHALEAPFPAQLHDAKAAVRYLRAHADELGISTERIGVMGESAGGHIAALVGLTAHRPDLEGTHGVVGPSSAVDVVVDWYGPADLATMPRATLPPPIAAKLPPELRVAAGGPADPRARGRRRSPTPARSPT